MRRRPGRSRRRATLVFGIGAFVAGQGCSLSDDYFVDSHYGQAGAMALTVSEPSTGGSSLPSTAGSPSDGGESSGGQTSQSTAGGNTGGANTYAGGAATGGDTALAGATSSVTGGAPSTGTQATGAMPASGGASAVTDLCPADPAKTAPGACGCGIAETVCCLAHRYSFDGTGTAAVDSVGTATGTVIGSTLAGGGVKLSGALASQYVDLPDHIVSALGNGTFEAWITWDGGVAWQRIFDFGSRTAIAPINGQTYLYLTPLAASPQVMRVSYSLSGSANAISIDGLQAVPTGVVSHVAVVIDATATTMSLYLNGALQKSVSFTQSLSRLQDVNNWLGHSQFADDPWFSGTFWEFRIYATARTAAQIAASYAAGPDTLPPC